MYVILTVSSATVSNVYRPVHNKYVIEIVPSTTETHVAKYSYSCDRLNPSTPEDPLEYRLELSC